MNYKTIILGLIEQQPEWFNEVSRGRSRLRTLHRLARQLKTRHEFWQEACFQTWRDCDPIQLSSMALELALAELEALYGPDRRLTETESLSLEEAMNYLRPPSLPA